MADGDKKGDKKEKPQGWNFDFIEFLVVALFFGGIIAGLAPTVWNFILHGQVTFFGHPISGVWDFIKSNSFVLKTIGFGIAGLGAIGTFVFNKKGDAIWAEVRSELYPKEMPMLGENEIVVENPENDRWKEILRKSESENPSDWRLAIIEADIMLDELLTNLRLPGENMGDKLKAVEQSDFHTIDLAWEAHKARNAVAHEGESFLLNQRETRRIISLYEQVFKEFHVI